MAAGLATLNELDKPGFFAQLSQTTQSLTSGLAALSKQVGIPMFSASVGGMFGFCFTDRAEIHNYEDVASADEQLFKRFYHGMLDEGIYLAPSMYEAGFVSIAHQANEIAITLQAAEKVLINIR